MKNVYLVSYDIMDPKRLHQVYLTMKGYGEHTQYSVFICRLTPKEKVMLYAALTEIIKQDEDRIIIANLGPAEGTGKNRIESIGRQKPLKDRSPTIV
ncbi:CRISPR-associated endonuclease Cas2 [Candidatus Micrarchaeota archaeon]|nr:CRISPR-associated endonuclease Cas2 [Candidatus Micrarchaeota archaeon]